ncbi:LptF/LptG family permease [Winogradskyella sp. KYW1333]|uniref:LptF/LptG family permease n=1 Tax=Winogradskyella sp. KYW1333 TaxID=2282123 RepID=UPI000DF1EE04|nr:MULTISPECIES: LptF/LptG family permease [unclassified Winogradskyella]MDB4752447.1 LptF/LptG family permease [Winogradskyella sp.]RCT54659.1 LptF/LptG family permease [Winogradskyella sp. KYW1333]
MKILDRYILITFLRTFFSVFIIFMFIFVLQGLWLYISELAGKDLDISVTAKFILYYMPRLIPLVVPLTILLTSIMVFGNFAENYEFAAMKSTGISLQRAMRSLSVFIVILGVACFFFANNVIPWGEYHFYNLRKNIAKVKPALAIAEGQFNEIGNINIKVDKKTGERGQYLDGVIIHEKSSTRTGNHKVIVSEKGELKSSPDSNVLQLELLNGNYYEEIIDSKNSRNEKKPHAKSYFESYIINVDLEILNTEDLDEKSQSDRYSMLDIKQLNRAIDTLDKERKDDLKALSNTLYNRSTYTALNLNIDKNKKDSLYTGELLDLFNLQNKLQIINLATNSANSTTQIIESNKRNFATKKIWYNKHITALHDKFVLAVACIILFFVGAPLGALIRKGGLGLPMVVAIVLFLTYHFFGIFAINSAEKGSLNPIIGSWLSTTVMLPLSIYLTSRATNDKGVFQIDPLLVPLKQLFTSKRPIRLSESETKEYNYYKKYTLEELVKVIKSQGEYDLDKRPKEIALHNLLNRNISLENLKTEGLEIPAKLIEAKSILKDFKDYSKTSLVSFTIGGILLILHFVFRNNKLPELAEASLSLSIISFIFLAIYAVVSAIVYSKFYKTINEKQKRINPIWFFITLPLYPLKYIFLKNRIEQHFYLSCINNIK